MDFNSYMVRLKASTEDDYSDHIVHFNSYMVRLKVAGVTLDTDILYIFQFLYGTIKRLLTHGLRCTLRYFNSYMVRLKESIKAERFI